LRLSTTGTGLGVSVSVGSGVNVRVGRSVSVGELEVAVSEKETLVDTLLAMAVGELDDPGPEVENVHEKVVSIVRRIKRYPFLFRIGSFYYCRSPYFLTQA
jgi:hypothetical protein